MRKLKLFKFSAGFGCCPRFSAGIGHGRVFSAGIWRGHGFSKLPKNRTTQWLSRLYTERVLSQDSALGQDTSTRLLHTRKL